MNPHSKFHLLGPLDLSQSIETAAFEPAPSVLDRATGPGSDGASDGEDGENDPEDISLEIVLKEKNVEKHMIAAMYSDGTTAVDPDEALRPALEQLYIFIGAVLGYNEKWKVDPRDASGATSNG